MVALTLSARTVSRNKTFSLFVAGQAIWSTSTNCRIVSSQEKPLLALPTYCAVRRDFDREEDADPGEVDLVIESFTNEIVFNIAPATSDDDLSTRPFDFALVTELADVGEIGDTNGAGPLSQLISGVLSS